MLLTDWDDERSVKRRSRYANFSALRKLDFLARMAYYLQVQFRALTFSTSTILEYYRQSCTIFDLPLDEAFQVTKEIESHTGLFIQSGYDTFEFSHKSLQEYLTAEYLVRLPVPPDFTEVRGMPNEVAIATGISSDPYNYLSFVVRIYGRGRDVSSFFFAYTTRFLSEKVDLRLDENSFWVLAELYSIINRSLTTMERGHVEVQRGLERTIVQYAKSVVDVGFHFRFSPNGELFQTIPKVSDSPDRYLPDFITVRSDFWTAIINSTSHQKRQTKL